MAEITRLDENVRFPLPDGEEIDWTYIRQLVTVLEQEIGKDTNTVVNLILDQTGNSEYVYFSVPDDSGAYPTGTWRIYSAESSSYLVQYYDGSSWVSKYILTADGDVTIRDITLTTPVNVYALSHDSFADFVANEHIDHSAVSILSGGILSGGGDITASRTLSLNHSDVDHDQTTNFAASEHFTEESIDHVNIQNIGTNTHAQIDTHIAGTGADHTYIDQNVTKTGNPTFTSVTAGSYNIVCVGDGVVCNNNEVVTI